MQEITQMAKDCGAMLAKVIKVDQMVFDPSYRRHCEANYCGKYGTNYGCPPDAGTPQEVIDRAKGYTDALVYFTDHQVSDYQNPIETQEVARAHWKIASCIEQEISAKTKTYLRLGVGACLRCSSCAKETGEPCRDKVVSSISAYCIDAAKLAELCGVSLAPQAGRITYIGLILF